jgi:hypothetical protein
MLLNAVRIKQTEVFNLQKQITMNYQVQQDMFATVSAMLCIGNLPSVYTGTW